MLVFIIFIIALYVCPLRSDFDDKFEHTQIIREHYVFLVDNLDAKHSGLVGELYQAEVLNTEEMESINSEVISFTRNEKMLLMLRCRSLSVRRLAVADRRMFGLTRNAVKRSDHYGLWNVQRVA